MRQGTSATFFLLSLALAVGFGSPARAACGVTYTFSNGTTADATQVNQNFTDLSNGCAPLASPTFTGTMTAAAANFSGVVGTTNYVGLDNAVPNSGYSAVFGGGGSSSNARYGVLKLAGTDVAGQGSYIRFDRGTTPSGWVGSEAGIQGGSSTATGLSVWSNATLRFYSSGGTLGGQFGTDGSFLVGTTTNGGWGTDAKLEAQTSTGSGVSGYATGSGGQAIRARIDNTGGALFSAYKNSTKIIDFQTNNSADFFAYASGGVTFQSAGSGGVILTAGATSWAAVSDERLKQWHVPQTSYRDAIKSLWIGSYHLYKDFSKTGPFKPMFGVRAQQAYNVLPANLRDMAIHRGDAKTAWTAAAEPMAYLALWGVKDLYKLEAANDQHNTAQDRRISALEAQNRALLKANADLSRKVDGLAGIVLKLQHANQDRAVETASR